MKCKTLKKQLNFLKILVYYQKELAKQFNVMLKKKKTISQYGSSLFGNILAGKGMKVAGERFIRAASIVIQ